MENKNINTNGVYGKNGQIDPFATEENDPLKLG